MEIFCSFNDPPIDVLGYGCAAIIRVKPRKLFQVEPKNISDSRIEFLDVFDDHLSLLGVVEQLNFNSVVVATRYRFGDSTTLPRCKMAGDKDEVENTVVPSREIN